MHWPWNLVIEGNSIRLNLFNEQEDFRRFFPICFFLSPLTKYSSWSLLFFLFTFSFSKVYLSPVFLPDLLLDLLFSPYFSFSFALFFLPAGKFQLTRPFSQEYTFWLREWFIFFDKYFMLWNFYDFSAPILVWEFTFFSLLEWHFRLVVVFFSFSFDRYFIFIFWLLLTRIVGFFFMDK